jgi:hypothetical protein
MADEPGIKKSDKPLFSKYAADVEIDVQSVDDEGKLLFDDDKKAVMEKKTITPEGYEILLSGNKNAPFKFVHQLTKGQKSTLQISALIDELRQADYKSVVADLIKNHDGKADNAVTMADVKAVASILEKRMNDKSLNVVERIMYSSAYYDVYGSPDTRNPNAVELLVKEAGEAVGNAENKITEADAVLADAPSSAEIKATATKDKNAAESLKVGSQKFIEESKDFITADKKVSHRESVKKVINDLVALEESRGMISSVKASNPGGGGSGGGTVVVNTNVQHVQALLKIAGMYAGKVNGVKDTALTASITRYADTPEAKKAGITKTSTIDQVQAHLVSRLATDAEFRKIIGEKTVAIIEANKDRENVKAAQVHLDRSGFTGRAGSKLVIDGLSPAVLRDKKTSNSYTALGQLKEKMGVDAVAAAKIVEEKKKTETVITTQQEAIKLQVKETEKVQASLKTATGKVEELTQFDTKAEKLVNEIKSGEKITAKFNELTGGDGRLKHQFKQTGDYHKVKDKDYVPQVNDVAFLKGKGGSGVSIVKVDADGKVYGKGEDGKPELIKASRIKGFGDASEFLESVDKSNKAKEALKETASELTAPAGSSSKAGTDPDKENVTVIKPIIPSNMS